ncbi:MAG: glycosyltransferase, partial [Planctomycetes bacterium]|nr:glycosyltransferase [Planctomycetota bacterium]
NPRYEWLGELPHERTMAILAGSDLHALSSRLEGGANVLCEAIACDVPSVSTSIASSIGILGADYPGFFPVGDVGALTAMLGRFESDASFRDELLERCRRIRPSLAPENEREALAALVAELVG